MNNKDDVINRIAVQFSGKHFDQYSYYNKKYCYSMNSYIKQKILITDLVSTKYLIVLDKPTPNASEGNLVADNNCNFEVYFELDSELNGDSVTSIPNYNGTSFQIKIAEDYMPNNFTQLEDRFKTFVHDDVNKNI